MRLFGLRKRLQELEERVAELEASQKENYAWYPMPPRHEIEITALPVMPDYSAYVDDDEGEEYRGTGLYL